MYLHIGGDFILSTRYIIGIFDFESAIDQTQTSISFIQRAEAKDQIEIVSPDIPRSYIVTVDRVYLSPISTATLRRRITKHFDE